MRRRHWILALATLPLAACTAAPEPAAPAGAARPAPAPALRLVAFDSCGTLLTDLRAAATRSVTPWGLPGNAPIPEAAGLQAGARTAIADGAAGYSTTNRHEVGADEPDIVKTDGRRIVTVDQGVLRVVDPGTHAQTGRLSLGPDAAGSAELLLAGDRALVLVRGGYPAAAARSVRGFSARPQVLLVDLAGPPRIISRYRGEGALLDARQTGTVARVVLSTGPKIEFRVTAAGDDAMIKQNRKAIAAAPVQAWLPEWEVTTGTSTVKGRLDCSAVSRPADYSGAAMLSVLTFDLAAPALTDGDPVAVLADGETVYGTGRSLYVANNLSWRLDSPRNTNIYKFVLPPAGRPVYASGGSVPGVLLNQYSMSEWDGHLRVATTNAEGTVSAVRILRDAGGKLTEVGEVGGLGKGERIYSVRFLGSRGYVVTFRQTDPLYSLDLADPGRPRVTGELKITGYSGHLQAVGDDRLLGVGQEATGQGRPVGTQISLFDVSDPAGPRRLDRHVERGSYSEAEYDPHALLWWPATNLLVLPVKGRGVLAFRVTADGISEQPLADSRDYTRRALVVGGELWTLSAEGLLASNLSTLDRTAWVPLR